MKRPFLTLMLILAATTLACQTARSVADPDREGAIATILAPPDMQPTQLATIPATLPPLPTATPELGMGRINPVWRGNVVTADGWELHILEYIRGEESWDRLRQAFPTNEPPPLGWEYILLKIKLIDHKDREETQFSLGMTGEMAVLYHWSDTSVIEPEPRLETEVADGTETEGWLAFLVKAGDDELMLVAHDYNDEYEDRPQNTRYVALDEGAAVGVPDGLAQIARTEAGRSPDNAAPYRSPIISDDWEVSLRDVITGDEAWQILLDTNQFNDPPEEGMMYVLLFVYVRYLGTKEASANISGYDFTIVDPDGGKPYETPSVVDPDPQLDFTLFPGGAAEGWVAVQAPADAKNMVVQVDLSYSEQWYLALPGAGR